MQKIKMFFLRNTNRIANYRLRSYFNISNNKFDFFFAKSKIRQFFYKQVFVLISLFRYFLKLKVDIHSIDYNLTTACNLRCKDCASLMPYYSIENQWTINFDLFKKDLDNLLMSVSKIYRLKLIGGEPLLVKDLEKMLEYACSKKQVISVIITTNARIVFSDELCSILQKNNNKALVELSFYPDVISGFKYDEIAQKLKKYNVYYFMSNYPWFETGKIKNRFKSKEKLISTYKNCFQQPCLSFFDGKIYCCTKAAAVDRLTDFNFEPSEIIDTRKKKNFSVELRDFYTKNYFTACNFCPDESLPTNMRGVQTTETMKIS